MFSKTKTSVLLAIKKIKSITLSLSIMLIKIYQVAISPYTTKKCKHYPSCSHYSVEAFSRFGILKGFVLSLARIIRCNPWSLGGFDPLPESVSFKNLKSFKLSGNYQNQLYQANE